MDHLLDTLLARLEVGMSLQPGSEARSRHMEQVLCEAIELRRNATLAQLGTMDRAFLRFSGIWRDFAVGLAAESVRRSSRDLLRFAVAALLLDAGSSDRRDFITAVALVANSADLLSVPAESVISTIDTRECRAADETAMRAVFAKARYERQIQSYGYRATSQGADFMYERLP